MMLVLLRSYEDNEEILVHVSLINVHRLVVHWNNVSIDDSIVNNSYHNLMWIFVQIFDVYNDNEEE